MHVSLIQETIKLIPGISNSLFHEFSLEMYHFMKI